MADTIEVTSISAVIEVNTPSKTIEVYKGMVGPQGLKGETGDTGASTWDGITDKPSTFPPSAHTHAISDITDLQTELDSKSSISTLADASSTLLVNAGYF